MRINEEKLAARVAEGKVSENDLRRALATERDSMEIVTLPTVGAMSSALNQAEAQARQQLDAIESDAAHNVAVIERVMTAQGWSTETYLCESCGKQRPTRTCTMCEMPSEY